MNCLFGFKLYLIINDKEEILNFMFTSGNADEREPLKQSKFLENIKENYVLIRDISDRTCLICSRFFHSEEARIVAKTEKS